MTTFLYHHSACEGHEPGIHHPESPDRLKSIVSKLSGTEFDGLVKVESPKSTFEILSLAHDSRYVESIFELMPKQGNIHLDPDTILSPGSGHAALRAVGGICSAIDDVFDGIATNAFCASRPPGHHAEYSQAMGFCLFNTVAIAAKYAQKHHGIERVAVIDFDVHHGNGTQHTFESNPHLFYGSSHQFPAYPGTGSESEIGMGNIVNVPLQPGSSSPEFRDAYTKIIFPKLIKFKPELLLVSAGFDAHQKDPLCQLNVKTADFYWITQELTTIAHDSCSGRLVSTLEGGYNLDALADCVGVHVTALMET